MYNYNCHNPKTDVQSCSFNDQKEVPADRKIDRILA